MKKREITKDIELAGRKWRIDKFDAQTGSFIAYQLLFNMLPGGDSQLGALPAGRPTMTREQFFDIQSECLKVCSEICEVGGMEAPLPVKLLNGAWGVAGLDKDTFTVLALTIHSLIHNVSGFFGEGGLKELTDSLSALNPFNTPK
jgi:hypothetical protein